MQRRQIKKNAESEARTHAEFGETCVLFIKANFHGIAESNSRARLARFVCFVFFSQLRISPRNNSKSARKVPPFSIHKISLYLYPL